MNKYQVQCFSNCVSIIDADNVEFDENGWFVFYEGQKVVAYFNHSGVRSIVIDEGYDVYDDRLDEDDYV